MKDQILKIAKVKSEKEFYKKYPTEEAFMKAHGKAFKKAAMGAKMVNTQLHQLTDFGNPPKAQVGTYIGGGRDHAYNPIAYSDALTVAKARNSGISLEEQKKRESLQQVEAQSQKEDSGGGGIGGILNSVIGSIGGGGGGMSSSIQDAIGAGFEMEYGGELHKAQLGGGISGIGQMLGKGFQSKGGVGSGLIDMFGGDSKGITSASQNLFKDQGLKGGFSALTNPSNLGTIGKAAGVGALNAIPDILGGIGQMQQQSANIKKADQFARLSNVTASAAESQPEQVKRKYVRPEDALVQPGQLGNPQGTGTNYLAQNGKSIGGNPTEIQNTYAPSNMYVGLGYEPLSNSNIKQYAYGGNIPTAEFGDYFQSSGQASIGKGVGTAIGSAVFGPLGGAVGGFLGGIAGNLFGGADDAAKLKHFQEVGQHNVERSAVAQGASAIQAQNANVMKDGGYTDADHKWISNGWNPQVITHFGDLNVSQVHNFAHQGMDSLRAGGHLKEYTPPSEAAMSTERPNFALGGDLQTTWGGRAETMSYNPYLPNTGETVMFKGQSHDETNGKGQSGIGVKYGSGGMTDYAEYGASNSDADVEVERDEPGTVLKDPKTGEDNLVVYGNMKIPDYGVEELEDKNAKGKKFKNYVADLSKKEAKHNKTIEKATEIVNNANGNDPFDQLSLNAGKAMIMGANAKLKDIADKKQKAAMVQNAILDTAQEFGVESDGLAKGKLRPIKDPSIGKDGKKLKKAQSGNMLDFRDLLKTPDRASAFVNSAYNPSSSNVLDDFTNLDPITREAIRRGIKPPPGMPGSNDVNNLSEVVVSSSKKKKKEEPIEWPDLPGAFTPDQIAKGKKKGKVNWKDIASTALTMYPFFRPTNQMPLDPSQLMGEMYALGNNQVQGVQAQTYQPMLDNPYDISLQDQINTINSQSRAAILAAGQDPASQAYIMSQAADAKNKVLGEQFRANQANKAAIYQANRQALNQAQLQNLGILDTQYGRQESAKSKTKAETIAALQSISNKIAQNKLENKTLGAYENLYNYRYDSEGRLYNINNPAQFNPYGNSSAASTSASATGTPPPGYKIVMEPKLEKAKRGSKITARNGSIVKALKTL